MVENIFAYTGPSGRGYPAFVSINRLDSGNIRVTIRGEAGERAHPAGGAKYMVEGQQVEIEVPEAEWRRMFQPTIRANPAVTCRHTHPEWNFRGDDLSYTHQDGDPA